MENNRELSMEELGKASGGERERIADYDVNEIMRKARCPYCKEIIGNDRNRHKVDKYSTFEYNWMLTCNGKWFKLYPDAWTTALE